MREVLGNSFFCSTNARPIMLRGRLARVLGMLFTTSAFPFTEWKSFVLRVISCLRLKYLSQFWPFKGDWKWRAAHLHKLWMMPIARIHWHYIPLQSRQSFPYTVPTTFVPPFLQCSSANAAYYGNLIRSIELHSMPDRWTPFPWSMLSSLLRCRDPTVS